MTTSTSTTFQDRDGSKANPKPKCPRCGRPLDPHCGHCADRVREFRHAMQDAGVPGYER